MPWRAPARVPAPTLVTSDHPGPFAAPIRLAITTSRANDPTPMTALDPRTVLGAYSIGVFPMADARDAADVYWVEPKRRAILPLDGFHLSHSLRRTIRSDRFRVTADRAFDRVIALCGEARRRPARHVDQHRIAEVFRHLHAAGFAHSIECWDDDRLVGGLYGLALGRAFFGEAMFSRATDASKVALAWLVARLRVGGFTLLDCQFQTAHLRSLGAIEIDRADYMALLGAALSGVGRRDAGRPVAGFDALDRGGLGPASGSCPHRSRARTSRSSWSTRRRPGAGRR